ncbi:MAG: hypothetical protein ACREJK_04440, partial [Candidatus Methylomirabilales bacterium]
MDEQRHTERQSSLLTAGLNRRQFLGGLVGLGFLGTGTSALADSPKAPPAQGRGHGMHPGAPAPYPTHPAEAPKGLPADPPPP